jgi:hypothetical protein
VCRLTAGALRLSLPPQVRAALGKKEGGRGSVTRIEEASDKKDGRAPAHQNRKDEWSSARGGGGEDVRACRSRSVPRTGGQLLLES